MNDSRNPLVSGFVKAGGKRVVNGDGQEILRRESDLALGAGRIHVENAGAGRPSAAHRRHGQGSDRRGEGAFWETYYERYITEADIRQIASEGFNSIRVPINARFIMEEGRPAFCIS